MNCPIYYENKSKLKLKRSRKNILFWPVFLFFPVILLGFISIYKHIFYSAGLGKLNTSSAAALQTNLPKKNQDKKGLKTITRKEGLANCNSGTEQNNSTIDQKVKPKPRSLEKKVNPGETLTDILEEYLSQAEICLLSRKCKKVFPLYKIRSGQVYKLILKGHDLIAFEYFIDHKQKLCISFKDNDFKVTKEEIQYEVRHKIVQKNIESSLFEAISQTGESAFLAIALAEIFAWDIDFIRDIRAGDSFTLIVKKKFRKNKFASYGKIIAAEFTNQGNTYHAFLYKPEKGEADYYTSEGQAVRKNFLKAPLNFSRISSGYSHARRHPILDIVRPHHGIDYAAPRGTSIKSVADGKVIAKAYGKGGGNYLKIRHPNGYVTVYNHMSRYASNISINSKIKQGQIIGYVGSTGLSTGPHLDYRVKHYGKYINPLHIKSKPIRPVPAAELDRFKAHIKSYLAVLNGDKSLYALSEDRVKTF